MEINTLTGIIIESAIKVHNAIGPGCYEKVYEECMVYELYRKNVEVHRQLILPISYEELRIENAYKLDLLIDERVIVEIKCVYDMHPVHFKQLNTYLKLLNLKKNSKFKLLSGSCLKSIQLSMHLLMLLLIKLERSLSYKVGAFGQLN